VASKPETTFYTGVHKYLPTWLYKVKMYNPFVGGIFDFWISGKHDLWVEYKFLVLPKRDNTMIDITLSPLQLQWGENRHLEGRNLAVIVGCREGGVLFRNRRWELPISCAEFKALLQTRAELARAIVELTGS